MSKAGTISTTLAVEGEKKYKESLNRINVTLAKLGSDMKLVDSEFRNNANTYDVLTKKIEVQKKQYEELNKKLTEAKLGYNNADLSVEKHIRIQNDLKNKYDSASQALFDYTQALDNNGEEEEKLFKAMKSAEYAMKSNINSTKRADAMTDQWAQRIADTQVEINNLNADLELNNGYMAEAAASADGTATSIDNFGRRIKTVGTEAKTASTDTVEAVNVLAHALVAAGVAKAFGEIRDAIIDCSKASIEFESAVTGVYKTVDGTPEQLAAISDGIKEMSKNIPITTTQLAAVAESAGQLGIATDDVLNFTEVMSNLGVSTNLSAEDAASSLAKFSNITNMSADNYERLGSTIVSLGNNFATTESDIVSMAIRLASTGSLVNISEANIMGVAAAMSSVGIEAEAGGTAISKLLKTIEVAVKTNSDSLKEYAKVAGMTADEFSEAWGNNAVSALDMFIAGLNDTKRNGKGAIEILEDMGVTETQLSNSVLALAKSGGILTEATDNANKAWNENIALSEEASKKYATTESRIVLLRNATDLLKIEIGDQLNPVLSGAIDFGTKAVGVMTDFIQEHEYVVPALSVVTAGVGALSAAVLGIAAWNTFNIAGVIAGISTVIAGPLGIVVGITAVSAALISLATTMPPTETGFEHLEKRMDEHNGSVEALTKSIEENAAAFDAQREKLSTQKIAVGEMIAELERLTASEAANAAEKVKIQSIVDELNSTVPTLSLEYSELTNKTNLTAEAIRDIAKAEQERSERQLADEEYYSKYKELLAIEKDRIENAKILIALNTALNEAEQALQQTGREIIETGRTNHILMGKQKAAYDGAQKAVSEYTDKQYTLNRQYSDAEAQCMALEKAINDYAAAEESAAVSTNQLAGGMDDIAESTRLSADEIVESAQEICDTYDLLTEAYQKAYDSAYSSIDGQNQLFAEQSTVVSKSVDEMLSSLQLQTTEITQYTELLKSAAQAGFSDGFVAELATGSAQSQSYLQTIVDEYNAVLKKFGEDSPEIQEFVDKFNTAFKDTETAKSSFSGTIAEMKTDFEKKASELEARATELGKNIDEGIISGLDEKQAEVVQKMQKIAQGMARTFCFELSINSPSKVFKGYGENIVEGLKNGIDETSYIAYSAVENLARGLSQTFNETMGMYKLSTPYGSVHSEDPFTSAVAVEIEEAMKQLQIDNDQYIIENSDSIKREWENIQNGYGLSKDDPAYEQYKKVLEQSYNAIDRLLAERATVEYNRRENGKMYGLSDDMMDKLGNSLGDALDKIINARINGSATVNITIPADARSPYSQAREIAMAVKGALA